MKSIDIKSVIIGVLLTTAVFFGGSACQTADYTEIDDTHGNSPMGKLYKCNICGLKHYTLRDVKSHISITHPFRNGFPN